jgi:tryptophan synthase alpha chain
LFELGIPFSDPLADGPTIQRAAQVALDQGITVARSLEMVAELRRRGIRQPFLLMGYANPFLQFGLDRLVAEAAQAGANGFIVPDLPYEEASEFEKLCAQHDMALIYLLAPTSSSDRILAVAARSQAFLYLVSLTGVTGARTSLPANLADFVSRVRKLCPADLPVAVGFGISTSEQAADVGRLADGVIIGSAFVNAVSEFIPTAGPTPEAASPAYQFIHNLRVGLRNSAANREAAAAEAAAYAPHHINPPSQTIRMTDALEDAAGDSQEDQGPGFLGC